MNGGGRQNGQRGMKKLPKSSTRANVLLWPSVLLSLKWRQEKEKDQKERKTQKWRSSLCFSCLVSLVLCLVSWSEAWSNRETFSPSTIAPSRVVQMSRCPFVVQWFQYICRWKNTQVNIYKSSLAVCCRYTFSSLLKGIFLVLESHARFTLCT